MQLPETGYVRLEQIIGNKKKGIPAVIPMSRTTWWRGVKSGKYPSGDLISPQIRAWRVESIRSLMAEMGRAA